MPVFFARVPLFVLRHLYLVGLLFALVLAPVDVSLAQIDVKFPDGTKYVKTKIVSRIPSTTPGSATSATIRELEIGVHFSIEPGWHIYWKNPGEAATATRIEWSFPDKRVADKVDSSLQWPTPYRFVERGDIITFGYQDEVLISRKLQFQQDIRLDAGEQVPVEAEVSWLVCKDICVPGRVTLSHTIDLTSKLQAPQSQKLFEKFRWQIPEPSDSDQLLPGLAAPHQLSLNRAQVSAGDDFVATILLPGFSVSSSEQAGNLLQLFPHNSDTFSFQRPYVARLAEAAGDPGGVLINIPVSTASDAGEGVKTISFTLALETPSNARVSMRTVRGSVEVRSNASKQTRTHDLEDYALDFVPLQYRTASHTEAPASPQALTVDMQLSPMTLLMAVLSAFVGGLLLNLMPCVLPILSLKVMGCISACDKDIKESRRAALSYSAGIIASFLSLAACIVLLKSMGISVGWGFQFQHPEFVAALAFIVFFLALGFFDYYSVQLPGMQSANKIVGNLHPSSAKHFFDGVLATALSTPCTAPFLGSALLVAFSQPASITFLLFFFVGVGLALPYAIFTTSPKLLCYLPRPGEWMCRVRQVMGFILLATVLWLLFVLHQLTAEGVLWALAGMLTIFFTFWLYEWASTFGASTYRVTIKCAALLLCLFALVRFYPGITAPSRTTTDTQHSSGLIDWQAYSESTIREAQKAGQAVFIDFTADWCVTCKANEFLVIETASVSKSLKEQGILAVKADWTSGDPEITEAIKRYGGEGVPLYVLLPGDSSSAPTVFPSLLTASRLINAFEQVSITRK